MSETPAVLNNVVRCGDNVAVLESLAPASVDLCYLDPPFNTGRTQSLHAGSYDDTWPDLASYCADLRLRIALIHRALKPTGSILLHCDWRTSHHIRLLLDDIFGAEHFVNALVWSYGLGGSSPRRFARKHDDILFYGRSDDYHFDPPLVPATSRRMAGQMKKASDVLEIPSLNNMARERTGYPTQKPLQLLRLLVDACCVPGGLVLDPYCGSGTTLVAAAMSGRGWIGIDRNPKAVEITSTRLQDVTTENSAAAVDAASPHS